MKTIKDKCALCGNNLSVKYNEKSDFEIFVEQQLSLIGGLNKDVRKITLYPEFCLLKKDGKIFVICKECQSKYNSNKEIILDMVLKNKNNLKEKKIDNKIFVVYK